MLAVAAQSKVYILKMTAATAADGSAGGGGTQKTTPKEKQMCTGRVVLEHGDGNSFNPKAPFQRCLLKRPSCVC